MINLSGQNLKLRRELDIENCDEQEHVKRIESICDRYNISIKVKGKNTRISCAVFAFGLHKFDQYVIISCNWRAVFGDIFAGKRFVEYASDFFQETDAPAEHDFVSYYDEFNEWKHIGIYMKNEKILSKWGMNPLYLHDLSHVPISYGVNVRFFKRLSDAELMSIFTDWAQKNRV